MGYSGHTSGENVVIVVTLFTVIAVLCCILRLWTRLRISRQAGIDDALAGVAACLNILVNACMCMQVRYGMGRHMDSLTPNELVHSLIWFYVSIPAYIGSLGIIKLSIVYQCLRVFGHIDWFRKASIFMIALLAIFTTWSIFISLFLCRPVNHFWYPKRPGKCLNKLAIWFFIAIFSIITDIMTAILPVTVVRSLKLPRRQRILHSCVFALGGIVCIISLIRFHALYAIAKSTDPSYDNPLAALWATMEINIGLIACSLPVLKGLVGRYFPKMFATFGSGIGSGGGADGSYELRGRSLQTIGSARAFRSKSQGGASLLGKNYGVMITAIEAEGEEMESHRDEKRLMPPSNGIQVTTTMEQKEEAKRKSTIFRVPMRPSDSGEKLVPCPMPAHAV
ncbi:hypothetical protein CBER1_02345 [Cercospora berteroae]|uniref:Rhodopsin domain-containing protein n=1 Tax=Cercospora berteroae TaxID=357750 RepID=A0A2S6CM14_9PEZI|nr:hypothetical protein CBER1_02345 [Cercospora berteroae]